VGRALLIVLSFAWAFWLAISLGWTGDAEEAGQTATDRSETYAQGYKWRYVYAGPLIVGIVAALIAAVVIRELRQKEWATRHPIAVVLGFIVALAVIPGLV